VAPRIFIFGTDKVEAGLTGYFSFLFFSVVPPPPGNFSADALDVSKRQLTVIV